MKRCQLSAGEIKRVQPFRCVQIEHQYFDDMQYIDLPLPKPKMWCIIKNTNTRSILGGVKVTERQKRMKELLIQSDAEITDQILSAVLAKFGTRPAGLSHLDPAQEVCPSFPKS